MPLTPGAKPSAEPTATDEDTPAPASAAEERKRAATTRFHKVRIAEVRRETDDAVSIAFDIPPELAPVFRYAPGQYLTLRTTVDGRQVRRAYSIASSPDDDEWRVAIKRVEGGLFSVFANERLRAGDTIDLMPPAGRFVLPETDEPRVIVAFAAGSGITPIASQMRTVLLREPESRVFLFYGNQTSRSIIFREAIEDLKDRYIDRLAVHNVLSRERQDIAALDGRIDGEKVATFMRLIVPLEMVDHFLLCGPPPFLEGIIATLETLGVARERILVERFTAASDTRAATRETREKTPERAEVDVTLDGSTTRLSLAPQERILDAAIEAGLDVPFSCRAGMCCTCRAKVMRGAVEMGLNYALSDDEVQEGFVLTCQATPTSQSVAVDFDAA